MKLISYNVNGIRAVLKKNFLQWLQAADPDVLCLQEIKANEDQFDLSQFHDLGYHTYLHPAEKKGYSGVAIFSKEKPRNVTIGCGFEKYDVEGRVIRADFEKFSAMSVYMPSGASKVERQVFKIQWLHDFYAYIEEINKAFPDLVISGDFNLCHQAIDIHDPYSLDGYPGFTPQERAWMTGFLQNGFVDAFRELNPSPHNYTWWSYRANARMKNLGWRIDYSVISNSLSTQLIRAKHLTEAYHSDHCPVSIELDI